MKIITDTFVFNLSKDLKTLLCDVYCSFFDANGLKCEKEVILSDSKIIKELIDLNENILFFFLTSFYESPSTNEISKNPSRFEKIFLKGETYIVNYRMSRNGLVAYSLYQIINSYKTSIKNRTLIKIKT